MTDITSVNLIARGYIEHKGTHDGEVRFFQKRFRDADGKTMYFVNFREWDFSNFDRDIPRSFDTQISCDTDGDGGYLWATLKEKTIEASEERADKMWRAAGAVYYD